MVNVWRLLYSPSVLELPFTTVQLPNTSKFAHASTAVFAHHYHWKSTVSSIPLVKKTSCTHYCSTTSSTEHPESDTTQNRSERFPFEGRPSKKKRVRDLGKALRNLNGPREYKVEKNDDIDGDRFYSIISDDGSEYSFPSVTTILSHTIPSKNYYSLKNWKKNVIKEVGEEGYKMVRLKATSSGSHLHRVSSIYCSRSEHTE